MRGIIMIRIHLSKLLGERRWTQAYLAQMTGIRPATISDIYNEVAERLNIEHLDRICEVLDCDLSDLGGMQFGTDGDGNCGYYGADGSLIPFNRMTDYTFYVAAQGYGGGLTFPRSFLDAAGFTKADIHSSKGMHAFNTATTHKNRILYSVHDEIGVDISSNGKFTEGFSVFQLGDGGTGGSWGTVRLYK